MSLDRGSAPDWLKRKGILFQPIRSTTKIWVETRHQYGISELRYNEVPRNWQNATGFRCIGVLFHTLYYYWVDEYRMSSLYGGDVISGFVIPTSSLKRGLSGADSENSTRRGRRNCGESAPPPALPMKNSRSWRCCFPHSESIFDQKLTLWKTELKRIFSNELQKELLPVVVGGLLTESSHCIHTSYKNNWK